MQQLTNKLRDGEMVVQEVPLPRVGVGCLSVRNHYSLISAGTEGSTVKAARKSLVGKAKERPQQVKQAIDVLRRSGPVQTYRAVMKKLDAYSPLGYSCAGEVLEVGQGVTDFQVGDLVACAGNTANHAEVVQVPVNLCVKLAPSADLKAAAYNTLGAIALQGIRQADLRLGESCVVIGLGLLGQLTCQLLRASGTKVFGIDVSETAVTIAQEHCADSAWTRDTPGIEDHVRQQTAGLGADAVIITAASSSHDPVNLAGALARKKGRVVVVGSVPTGFDREPHYYRKELELRMSCSYGPGRYDAEYEEKGHDYPAAYVRWTEKRNMQAFQELLASGRVNLDYLTTHEFPLERAPEAYQMILDRSEPFLGIVLKYDTAREMTPHRVAVKSSRPTSEVGIGFIGAGSYAQGNLLPHLPKDDAQVVCRGVMTASGTTSKRVAEKFGFEFCTSQCEDILTSDVINTVFIATRHDSHADYVERALAAGKHVFVEKPLALNEEELSRIDEALAPTSDRQLLVGFNRRYAPLAEQLKKRLGNGPVAMTYRVNAGKISADSWIHDPEVGGGRIIGECCHFVDFLTFLAGSLPVRVHASAVPDPEHHNDTLSINLEFENGSVGSIAYFANGSPRLAKEYVEVHQNGVTGILHDFRKLEVFGAKRTERKKQMSQDKGQRRMVNEFLRRVQQGGEPLIPARELFAVTRATFAAVESVRRREAVAVDFAKHSRGLEGQ
jgi:predicted dehydrogenase/threonine dehydrogenase-like Zn-dependent dehydrogenase